MRLVEFLKITEDHVVYDGSLREAVSSLGTVRRPMMEEKIVQAAFYDPDTDTIYPVGEKHNLQTLFGYGIDEVTVRKIINPENQGFLTDRGRWLDRKTAAKLSHTGNRNPEHEMDSAEIPIADPFEIKEPPHSHVAEAAMKLSSPEMDKSVAFVKEVFSWAHPNPIGRGVVFGLKDDDGTEGMVLVDLQPKKWGVHIDEIHTLEGKTGKGFGDYILKKITDLADKMGVTLSLFAVPLQTAGKKIPKNKLKQFYGKHGFKSESGGDLMTREQK